MYMHPFSLTSVTVQKKTTSFFLFSDIAPSFAPLSEGSDLAPPSHSLPIVHNTCSAQTRTGVGHLRKPPGVELIPCCRKPLRRMRTLRDPAQTQV